MEDCFRILVVFCLIVVHVGLVTRVVVRWLASRNPVYLPPI
jgi:hypothetical protein